MSPRQPVVTAKKLIKALEKKGFTFRRMTGSHAVYKNDDDLRAIIPVHAKFDLGTGLLAQILKDANMNIEELKELL